MAYAPWRAALLPASFGGAGFQVEAGGFGGGRRLVMHEYAHLDTPFTEDMGRKGRRWQITGYCIGPDYLAARDALIAVCEAEGPFTLVHPSLGSEQAHCDVCNPVEVREKGGYCVFELVFFEAGQNPGTSGTADTQAQAQAAASASSDVTAATTDVNLSGQTGGGVGGISAGAGSGDPLDGTSGVTGGYPSGITPGPSSGLGSFDTSGFAVG